MNHNGKFKDIKKEFIEKAFKETDRQYFVGNLGLPQILDHIDEKDIEIGITSYDSETYEKPHWHPVQKEFQYMLSGETTYKDVLTGEEITYNKGDFYSIYPEICYEQWSKPSTSILFIKVPAINDKMVCKHCDKGNCPSRLEQFEAPKNF